MNNNNDIVDVFVPPQCAQDESFTPLEYSAGEICKCYYNEVKKSPNEKVSQSILKCQSYGRVVERDKSNKREYAVEIFDPVDGDRVRRLPGCCLRKVKVLPFNFEESTRNIGRVVRSKGGDECMMIVTVSREGNDVRINDIPADVMLKDFEFVDNGSPCGRIVMLKADEAFGGAQKD